MTEATRPLHIISSMATRQVLSELAEQYRAAGGPEVKLESVGGVDAARRVQAGEPFDGVILAANAIDQLIADAKVLTGSRVDIVKSGIAIAVRAGAPHPSIADEAAVRKAVKDAATLGYSTGPSGVYLMKLFERWGIAEEIKPRIVQAPPGIPVGSLVAKGDIALGFQQLSELLPLEGIDILGPMPADIQSITTFSGGVAVTSQRPDAVRALLAFMASPQATPVKQRNGMDTAA